MNNIASTREVEWDQNEKGKSVGKIHTSRPVPATKQIDTDSEEDPEFNQDEFVRLRTSLHRKIEEAEACDRAKRHSRATNPCRKITQLFQRIFTSNSKRLSPEDAEEPELQAANLSNLKSPSSPNQKLGELSSSTNNLNDDDDEEDGEYIDNPHVR